MLIGDSLEPFANIPSIEFVLALVLLLFLEGRRLVKDNLALFATAVHTYCPFLTRALLLNILYCILEFSGADTMLDDNILNFVSVVVLF